MTDYPTIPPSRIEGFRKAVAALARAGVVPKVRLLSSTYRLPSGDDTYGDLHKTRYYAVIAWHREEAGDEIEESYVRDWVPEELAPDIDVLFIHGAQEYEPDPEPYVGDSLFGLKLKLDAFALRCDSWTSALFGAPLDEIDRCVEIMNTDGEEICQC